MTKFCRHCGVVPVNGWQQRTCSDCSRLRYVRSRVISGGQYCGARVHTAVNRGLLPRPDTLKCADCGAPAKQYDHRDYTFPLLVEAVCRSCNVRRGKAVPRRWGPGELRAHLSKGRIFQVVPWAREWCLEVIENHCSAIERATGGEVTRHDLRPDIYPRESAAA